MDATRKGCELKGGSTTKGSNTSSAMHQWDNSWEQHEILAFIKCNFDEHVIQKALVDLRAHMIPTA
jgi:hypothetical protein